MGVSETSDHILIKNKIPDSSQEPPASSKAPNEDLKDMDVLCTFKIKIECQNLDHGCVRDQWPYPNQDQDAKPQSGTSSVLQSPKWRHKGHGCSLHLQNQDKELKFWSKVDQGQLTRSTSRSKYPTPVRNLQCPLWLQSGLKGHECSLHFQNQDRDPKFETWVYQRPVTISKSRSKY